MNPNHKMLLHHRCEALFEAKQYELAVKTASPENLAHNIFHQLLKIRNLRPKQGELQQRLLELKSAHNSGPWQSAFTGGLIEFASFVASKKDTSDLDTWNSAMRELFEGLEEFAMLLRLFDVLTRVKVLNDRKALLELPREQRLLLISENEAEAVVVSK